MRPTLKQIVIAVASLLSAFTTEASIFAHRQFGGLDHPVNVVLKQLERLEPTALDAPPVNASFFHGAVVDHFGGLATRPATWSQRFYVDDRFWGGAGSPVFLYIGGEGPQGPPSPRLFFWTLAEEHSALMVSGTRPSQLMTQSMRAWPRLKLLSYLL